MNYRSAQVGIHKLHTKPWLITADDGGRRITLASYDTREQVEAAFALLNRSDMGIVDARVEANPNIDAFGRVFNARDNEGRLLRSLTCGNDDAMSAAKLAFELGRRCVLHEQAARAAASK